MTVISKVNELVLQMLKNFLRIDNCTRWSQYCVQTPVEDGVLVFNMLTRELVLLSKEEHDSFTDIDYLKEHWFVVPETTKEKEYADLVKWVLSARQSKSKDITGYTIFTTTDCNARCFYCFELGRSRFPMSCETAEEVVQYIKAHCGGKEVKITWFGGEPLFNQPAIEAICKGLHRNKIPFTSTMVSNGYLFDDETVQKAVKGWNLKSVQITLDGTEKVYNKIKAYIYREGNPYEIVMSNIERLLDTGIRVSIRLNMDLYNAENLLALAEELAQHFRDKKGLSVYAQHLFKDDTPDAELYSEEEWDKREAAMYRLNECLDRNGLSSKGGISKKIKVNHCKADSGRSVTILPDGNIGLCEHYTESEFIGHIDKEGFDESVVESWKERMPEIPECATCFYYLDCIKLKKCASSSVCYKQFRQEKLRSVQRAMVNEYRKWQTNTVSDEDEDDGDC